MMSLTSAWSPSASQPSSASSSSADGETCGVERYMDTFASRLQICALSSGSLCVIYPVCNVLKGMRATAGEPEPLQSLSPNRDPSWDARLEGRLHGVDESSCPRITCWQDAVSVAELHLHVAAVVALRAEA